MAVWLASWLFFAMIAFIGSGGIAPCLHCTLSAFLHTNAVRHFALDFESKLLARYNFSLLLPSSRLCERWLVVGFLYILFFRNERGGRPQTFCFGDKNLRFSLRSLPTYTNTKTLNIKHVPHYIQKDGKHLLEAKKTP